MGIILSILLSFWGNITGTNHHITLEHLIQTSMQVKQAEVEQQKQQQAEQQKKQQEQEREKLQPFKPIFASKAAKSLTENYTKDIINQTPLMEAKKGNRKRSVPFGQTILSGMVDKTNGPLKKYRIVSFYGTPQTPAMGILGQLTPDMLMIKLKDKAKVYANLDPSHPVIPAIELITTIADRYPGPHGLYFHQIPDKYIEQYAKLAKDNGAILILDVQLGRDTIMHQVQSLEKYLKLPYVYIAIDTEFHVRRGETPGVELGHVDGNNMEKAIQYISKLIEQNHLPDKIVFVHQFRDDIIRNKQEIKPTEHIEVVVNGDGFGGSGNKMAGYRILVRDEPIQYGGFKVFLKEDHPVLTPKEVLTLDPAPAFINYQ